MCNAEKELEYARETIKILIWECEKELEFFDEKDDAEMRTYIEGKINAYRHALALF